MNKKLIALLLTLVLLVGVVAGGTIAWLTAQTPAVTNTFTVGDINIELKEHKLVDGTLSATETVTENTYAYVPGDTLPKDPFVTVLKDSEKCYVFVKIEVTGNEVSGLTVLDWAQEASWKTLPASDNTNPELTKNGTFWFYQEVEKVTADEGTKLQVLANNQIKVNPNITKAMVDSTLEANAPVIKITAAAVQMDHLTLTEAFNQIKASI